MGDFYEVSRNCHELLWARMQMQQIAIDNSDVNHQMNNSLMEENLIQARIMELLTLETVASLCNSTCAETTVVSPQYLHYNEYLI